MEIQLKKVSNLLGQLNEHIIIINNIIYEINQIIKDNNKMNENLNNTINSLNECSKKINQNNYNNMETNSFFDTYDKKYFNDNRITITFKNFDKERSFECDSNTPMNQILRAYLEESGSLKMPKKPIFLYKGTSLNPNDKRKIGDLTKDYLDITVDYF